MHGGSAGFPCDGERCRYGGDAPPHNNTIAKRWARDGDYFGKLWGEVLFSILGHTGAEKK